MCMIEESLACFLVVFPPALLDATIPSRPPEYPGARACAMLLPCVCSVLLHRFVRPSQPQLLIASETAQEVDSLEELGQFRQEGCMPRVLMALSPTPYTTKVYTYRCLGSFPGPVSGSTFRVPPSILEMSIIGWEK